MGAFDDLIPQDVGTVDMPSIPLQEGIAAGGIPPPPVGPTKNPFEDLIPEEARAKAPAESDVSTSPFADLIPKGADTGEAPAGAFSTFGSAALRTAIGLPGGVIRGLGVEAGQVDTGDDTPIVRGAMYRMGDAMVKYADTWGPTPQSVAANPISNVAGSVVGGMAAAAPAILASTVGAPAAITAGLGLGAAATFALSAAGDTFNEALLKGADENAAAKAANFSAIVAGGLGTLNLGAIIGPVRAGFPLLAGWAGQTIDRALMGGITFATIGEAQEFLGRQIAKNFYDPDAGYSPDISRVIGGLLGGGLIHTITPSAMHDSRTLPPISNEDISKAGAGLTSGLSPEALQSMAAAPRVMPRGPVEAQRAVNLGSSTADPITPPVAPPPPKVIGDVPQAATYGTAEKPVIEGPSLDAIAEAMPMSEEFVGQTGANVPDLLAIVGKKMYGDPSTLSPTTIKEFLQNSFDATKVLPGEKGPISIDVNDANRSIIIHDHGRGMTPEVLSGPFLEAASTYKEGEQSSGRFGLAKLLTLYESEAVKVVTLRDGIVSRLETTGPQMKASLRDLSLRPIIQAERLENLPREEQKRIQELFPQGHGTRVETKVPETYEDDNGVHQKLELPDWYGQYKVLQHSPLFHDIEVRFNGTPLYSIGKHFPANDYTRLFDVNFDKWGKARVIITKTSAKNWGSNLHILSNGIWQFTGDLKMDPQNNRAGYVPHQIYIDVVPFVDAKSAHYPFDMNRQRFTIQAQKEFGTILNYISKMQQFKGLQEGSVSYGTVQYMTRTGTPSKPTEMAPERPRETTALNRLKEGDNIEVRNGELVVGGKVIPELSKADLESMNFDVGSLLIPQDKISSTAPMLHNNVELKVPGAGPDEYIPLTTFGRNLWPGRFDKFIADVGYTFIEMRDKLYDIMKEENALQGFEGMKKSAIGLTFDETQRGVSTVVPFQASFLNPSRPLFTDLPSRIAASYYDTMIHELAHFKNRNHSADFREEMKRFYILLGPHQADLMGKLVQAATENHDIVRGLNGILDSTDKRTVGNALRDASEYETRDERRANNLPSVGAGGRGVDRLFARPGERAEPPQQLSHADRMAEEVTSLTHEPPEQKGFLGYHGSAFDFRSFDPKRIGTNEGTSQGHGFYIAGNPHTGARYQDKNANFYYNGVPYDATIPEHRAAFILQQKGSLGAAIEWLETSAARGTLGPSYEKAAAIDAAASMVLRAGEPIYPLMRRGNLYTVEVTRPKDHFIDLDLTLDNQSKYVRDVLARSGAKFSDQETGRDIYELLSSVNDKMASDVLHKAGIAGLKYLDAGSRNADPESQTQNFVVFNEKDLAITHKNGELLPEHVVKAIQDVQKGMPVEKDSSGRAIVNGYTVDSIAPSELRTFAAHGTPKDGTGARPNGYDVNAKAMADSGVTDFPKTPVTETSGGGRNMLTKLFGGEKPPGAEAGAVAADHFWNKVRWLWDMRSVVDANPDIEPLVRMDVVRDHMNNEATQRQVLAEDTWRVAMKLSEVQQQAVYKFIDDFVNMRFLTQGERNKQVIRKPTDQEFAKLVKESGMDKQGLDVFKRMQRDFEKFTRDMLDNMRMEALDTLPPQRQPKELDRINQLEKQLLNRPYFPITRFGLFTIIKQSPRGPEFYRTETKKEQAALFKKLMATKKPDEKITTGKLPQSSLPFSGLPVQLLEFIEKSLLPKSEEAEQLRNAISQLKYESSPVKGITKKLANANIVPGYSQDFFRSYANFFYHGSRYLARQKYNRELKGALSDLWDSVPTARDGTLRAEIAQFAQDHYERMLDPRGDWAITRGMMFHMALGFRPASAAANLTQTLTSTFPHMAAAFGDIKTLGALTKAGTTWNNFYKRATVAEMTDPQMRALHELMQLGRIRGALAPNLAGASENRNFARGYGKTAATVWNQFTKMSASMFEAAEQTNRRLVGMATYDLAMKDPKNKFVEAAVNRDPQLFAELQGRGFGPDEARAVMAAKTMIDRTQFQYSREYRPQYLTGPIGSTIGMFKLYQHRMMWNLYNYPAAATRTLLIMGALGGMMGIPGMQDLTGILKAIAFNIFGKDFDLEKKAREFAVEVLGMKGGGGVWDDPMTVVKGFASRGYGIPAMADFIGEWAGVGKIPIPELDRSAAISLGNLLPIDFGVMFGPGAVKDPGDAFAQSISRGMGALGSYAYNVYKAMENSKEGTDSLRRWEKVAPVFLSSMSHAARVWKESAETNQAGARILRYDPHDTEHMMEIIAIGLGYTTTRESKEWTRIRAENEAKAFYEVRKEALLAQYWSSINAKDFGERDRILAAIKNYNKELSGTPAAPLMIKGDTLEKSVRNRAVSKAKQEAGVPQSIEEFPLMSSIRRLFPGTEIERKRVQ